MAGEALPRAAEGAKASEEPAASLAAVDHARASFAEAAQRIGLGCAAVPGAERAREPPEETSMPGVGPVKPPGPRVGGLVAQCVLLFRRGKVGGDYDRVRGPVDDLSARELAPREADARRIEAEAPRQSVIENLET